MFKKARIRLTLWYLVIIMTVSGFFSLIVYRGFTKEIGRGFHYQTLHSLPGTGFIVPDSNGFSRILPFVIYPEDTPPEEVLEIISVAKSRFALQLLIINGGILIIAGTAGYFLAGKTLEPIELMVSEQKRFVADASHELRTPLTSMKTEIEVALRDKKFNLGSAKNQLESNLEEVDKMKYFTDYLLSLSRYEAGINDLQMEEVDVAEAINQAIQRNNSLAKEKKIEIRKDLSDIIIKGNPQSLVEMTSILINNAIKYSGNGKNIRINLRKLKKYAEIRVKDEGIGIDQKDIPHIFDRFYRADLSRNNTKIDGFGLGLSIAKSIIDLHKGSISVESKEGKGSTFIVMLPR